MAENKKVSELDAAPALTGDELLHVVQGGNSRQTTVAEVAAYGTVNTFSDLADLTASDLDVGDYAQVTETGFVVKRVSSSGDLDYSGSGGVQFDVMPAEDGSYSAAMFGAAGDGSTDDTAALQAALDAAGADGIVRLAPGATYLISTALTTSARQKIVGNGATIKRCDQVVTTTTTAITNGVTTSVTLDDATGLEVGMTVAFAEQGVARGSLDYGTTLSIVRTITDVSGNTITLNAAPDIDVSIGGTCFLTFQSLVLEDGASVTGVTFDGNRANWPYARWEVTAEIVTTNDAENRVNACRFVNVPGEAILLYSDDSWVTDCYFDTVGGNGVHLSGVARATIKGNRATNGNIDTDVGHGDGFVSFSNNNSHVVVTGNEADQWIAGVGAINNTDSDVTVNDNDFWDMYCAGVEGGAGATRITVADNRMNNIGTDPSKKTTLPYYGGLIFIGMSGEAYSFTDNTVTNTPSGSIGMIISNGGGRDYKVSGVFSGDVRVSQIEDFSIDVVVNGGTLYFAGKRGKGRATITTSGTGVRFNETYDYEDLDLEVNVTGGTYGIDISASATAYRNVNISGTLVGQTDRGVSAAGTAPTIEGLSLSDLKIRTSSAAKSSFIGLLCAWDEVTIDRVKAYDYQPAASRIGIHTSNASSAPKMVIKDCEVRGNWNHTILPAASSGVYEINNVLDKASSNQTGNNISGETVI